MQKNLNGKCILKIITRLFVLKILKYKEVLCRTENFQCIFLIKLKIQFLRRINGFLYYQSVID